MTPELQQLESDLKLKRLSPGWAKAEIFIGLACVWLSLNLQSIIGGPQDAVNLAISLGLFVGGGYLASAGSRSHLYQSNNRLVAYLSGLIRNR